MCKTTTTAWDPHLIFFKDFGSRRWKARHYSRRSAAMRAAKRMTRSTHQAEIAIVAAETATEYELYEGFSAHCKEPLRVETLDSIAVALEKYCSPVPGL